MKARTRLVLSAIGAVALVGVVTGLSTLSGASRTIGSSRIVRAEVGTIVRSVVATGKVEPITKVEIKSKANGIIKALHAEVGVVVERGEVLAELDKDQLMAELRGAEANLLAARAALEGAAAQLRKNVVEAEGPDEAFARRTLARAQALFSQSLIPQSALDDAQSALDVAENKRRVAHSQLAVSKARVSEAGAQVAQAQASADRAAEDLANATIRAPIRGTVLIRNVEVGSAVSSILNLGANATLVVTLGDIDHVFVRGQVDEADIGQVRLDQPARIRVETFRDQVFNGRVTLISPMGVEEDAVTSFEVRVSIENPGNILKANMTANAEIVLEEHPGAVLIPEAAVQYDAERRTFVEVVAPEVREGARRIEVSLGIANGTEVEVLDGLQAGDEIVQPL